MRAMYPDIDEARAQHGLLKQIVDRHAGAAADYRALRRVLELCRRAAAAVDDRYCRDKLRVIEDFAAEMFSHSEHRKWDRESMSGEQFLKQQILGALELFHSRLYSLEAGRRKTILKSAESLRA
jgi:signal transduction protein with GAF and PtsI domain